MSERREASGALKRTYLTVKGGRRVALITTFTALCGMSHIAHSIMSGSPLCRHRSQPSIHPDIPSGVPWGLNPGHSHEMPESKPLVQQDCSSWYKLLYNILLENVTCRYSSACCLETNPRRALNTFKFFNSKLKVFYRAQLATCPKSVFYQDVYDKSSESCSQ